MVAALLRLRRLKHLPKGWKFHTMVIDRDLILKADGAQPIMWDELGNSWDALVPGTVNFMPTAVPEVLSDGANDGKHCDPAPRNW
jgi:hypothetical protein